MRTTNTIGLALIGLMSGLMSGLMPGPAGAQTPPAAPEPVKAAVEVTKADIEAAARIGMAALKPGVSVSDRNISLADIGAYAVTVAYVTRPATTVQSGNALRHDKITEIYYVVRGSGTQVTGTLVDPVPSAGSATIGPGATSKKPITGGRTVALGPGEMQIIPPGLGHAWAEIGDGGIVYMVIRVDPEHVLGISK